MIPAISKHHCQRLWWCGKPMINELTVIVFILCFPLYFESGGQLWFYYFKSTAFTNGKTRASLRVRSLLNAVPTSPLLRCRASPGKAAPSPLLGCRAKFACKVANPPLVRRRLRLVCHAPQWGVELLSRLLCLFAFFDLGKSSLTTPPMGRGDTSQWGDSASWLNQPTA